MEGLQSNTGEEKKGLAKEKTSSPEVFIDSFLKSDMFLNGRHDDIVGGPELRGYNDFIRELKARKVDEPEKEIKESFLGMHETKLLLLHFAKHELMFEYNDKNFSKDNNVVCRAFDQYKAIVKKSTSERTKVELEALPIDIRRDRILEMDSERQFRHIKTLRTLYSGGYVPSEMIGRAMSRLMLISEGLDTFKRAQYAEEQRFINLARAANSRI